jgi:hypothetical protein
MTPVSDSVIESAISIIGTTGIADDVIERDVRAVVADDMTARRLIDWIPEAFGLVLVSHISSKLVLPTTFSAQSREGEWRDFNLVLESIFVSALLIAQKMFHNGPREIFRNVSERSSMTSTVNNALNAGVNLDGAQLSGPALIGIPAEVYLQSE